MPARTSEVKHYHEKSRQFFFIISGKAMIEVKGEKFILTEHEGIEIPPKTLHKISNDYDEDLHFIVVSQPKSHGDRVVIKE